MQQKVLKCLTLSYFRDVLIVFNNPPKASVYKGSSL